VWLEGRDARAFGQAPFDSEAIPPFPCASVCIPVQFGRTAKRVMAMLARRSQREFPSTHTKGHTSSEIHQRKIHRPICAFFSGVILEDKTAPKSLVFNWNWKHGTCIYACSGTELVHNPLKPTTNSRSRKETLGLQRVRAMDRH